MHILFTWTRPLVRAAIAAIVFSAALLSAGAAPSGTASAQEGMSPATGRVLVANPRIRDPRFAETVILLLKHDRTGTTGIILNRPSGTRLTELFPELPEAEHGVETVHFGGPVGAHQLLMLIRSKRPVRSAARVYGDLYVTSSERVMRSVVRSRPAGGAFRVYAGYAGWAVGQLELELRRGDWAVLEAETGIVFRRDGSTLWQELFRRSSEIEVLNGSPGMIVSGRR